MRFAPAFIAAQFAFAAEASACQWPRWRFHWDQTVDVAITTGPGQSCGRQLYRATAVVDEVRVATRPANGVAGVNTASVAYLPRKGFIGRDFFTFELISRNGERGARQVATVRVHVTVGP